MVKSIKTVLVISFVFSFIFCCTYDMNNTSTGKGSIVVSFEITEGKTITPPEEETIPSSYILEGSGPDGNHFSIQTTDTSIHLEDLVCGEWEISVTAVNMNGISIGYGAAIVEVKPDQEVTATIRILCIEGYGSLDIKVRNASDSGTTGFEIKALLTSLDEEWEDEFTFNKRNDQWELITQLESGYYTIELSVIKDGTLVGGIAEIVWIVTDLVSNFEYEFEFRKDTGTVVIIPVLELNKPIDVKIFRFPKKCEIEDHLHVDVNELVTLRAQALTSKNIIYRWYENGKFITEGQQYEFTSPTYSYTATISVIAMAGGCGGSKSITVSTYYTVKAYAGDGGTISPSGESSAVYCDSMTFTITPDNIHRIKDVTVNGVSRGQVDHLEFPCIQEDLDIYVTFEENWVQEIFEYPVTTCDDSYKCYEWCAPHDIYNNKIYVRIAGGGGGGGGYYDGTAGSDYNKGQGGSEGEYIDGIMTVIPGAVYTMCVGRGGNKGKNDTSEAGNQATDGKVGYESSIKDYEANPIIIARRGNGGKAAGPKTTWDPHPGVSDWPGYGNGGWGGMIGSSQRPSDGREGRIEISYILQRE